MVKEGRNAVPKHPSNGWIYFFQEQSKMTKKSSSKRMSMSEIRAKWKALGDKAKQKYIEKAKLSSEVYKEQKVKETFTTRTQLKTACDIIRNLESQQVESVKAMGFGGLLRLKCTRLDRKLCEQLVSKFDPVSLCLYVHGKSPIITPLDVHHILGLPCEGKRVILKGNLSEILPLCETHCVGAQSSISLRHLENYVRNTKDNDDNFKVAFVLFIMGAVLCPTSELGVNRRFLHAVKDVSSISELNWSQFVLDFLAKGIQKYQDGRKVIRGCILFLMLFYFEHCTPAIDFISPCACRPSPRLVQWGDKEIRDRIRWLDQSSSGKLKIIVEDGVGKRGSAVDQGKEIGQNIPMERFQGIEELNSILKKLASIMETMDVGGKKTNENSLAAKVSMDMKGTPSPVVNEKKGKKELSFDSSISPLTNKEKDKKEQSSGHLTSPLKANQEENTKKPSLSHLTSPLKTNKEQDMKEPKIKPSSKRLRKMATNIGDIMSSTAPPTIGMNKRQKKCQQEIPRTTLKGSQPVKKNANKKPAMECQQEMARTGLKESQPEKKNANEKPPIGMVQELILRFVFDTTLSVRDQLCNFGISYATRSDFMSLRKNGWVVGEIINAVALRKTLIQSKRDPDALWPSWYLPTYLASYALNGGINSRTWVKYYGGSSRYTGILESMERVYIPINENNIHWFMCVVNFKHANVYVLDSLPSLSKPKVQNEKVLRVLEYLDDVIQHLGNNGCVMKAHKLPIKRLKWLPVQEPGSDDCGVHTAKYFDLEQFNEEEAVKLRFNSEEGRNNLILDLILCGENVIRNEVIRKAQEKYRNTRRII
ncbi:uncharacterized protein LOC131301994 isoform X2 [Rhododendron vialii]|uniref:uncharacterized protein LOC131301994 isoform X2 n=1 Tax=Rhododendron vialii TaxID=182163 RepID=UPI00265EC558|nr:uncharacterized protein LOC131301994 isoform X2 [Rhododendron vialii]